MISIYLSIYLSIGYDMADIGGGRDSLRWTMGMAGDSVRIGSRLWAKVCAKLGGKMCGKERRVYQVEIQQPIAALGIARHRLFPKSIRRLRAPLLSFLAHSLTLTFTVSRLTFIVQHSGQVAVLSL